GSFHHHARRTRDVDADLEHGGADENGDLARAERREPLRALRRRYLAVHERDAVRTERRLRERRRDLLRAARSGRRLDPRRDPEHALAEVDALLDVTEHAREVARNEHVRAHGLAPRRLLVENADV